MSGSFVRSRTTHGQWLVRVFIVAGSASLFVPSGRAQPAGAASAKAEPQVVVWPNAATIDRRTLTRLPPGDLESVQRSPVPVLLPSDSTFTEPTLVVKDAFYAVSGRMEGAAVYLQGSKAAYSRPALQSIQPTHAVRGTMGFASENEDIQTVTWIESGAIYALDLECGKADDARCADEAAVLDIANRLVYVGGSGK